MMRRALTVEDHTGKEHEVYLVPGEMIFYESAICRHGRPYAFNGSRCACWQHAQIAREFAGGKAAARGKQTAESSFRPRSERRALSVVTMHVPPPNNAKRAPLVTTVALCA